MGENLLQERNRLIEAELAVIMIMLLIRELRRNSEVDGISEDIPMSENTSRPPRTRGYTDYTGHVEW